MAKDYIHEMVRKALENDNWVITKDPYTLDSGGVSFDIDLAAEKWILAKRNEREILVELKTFGAKSMVYSFHNAIGQYINNRGALSDEGIKKDLYLGISNESFEKLNKIPFFIRRFKEHQVRVIVFDLKNKKILKWLEYQN